MDNIAHSYLLAPEGQPFKNTFEFLLDMESAEIAKLNPEVAKKIESVLSADQYDNDYYDLVDDVFNTEWVFEAYGAKHKLVQCYGVWVCQLH